VCARARSQRELDSITFKTRAALKTYADEEEDEDDADESESDDDVNDSDSDDSDPSSESDE
jgi:hypothetical protein